MVCVWIKSGYFWTQMPLASHIFLCDFRNFFLFLFIWKFLEIMTILCQTNDFERSEFYEWWFHLHQTLFSLLKCDWWKAKWMPSLRYAKFNDTRTSFMNIFDCDIICGSTICILKSFFSIAHMQHHQLMQHNARRRHSIGWNYVYFWSLLMFFLHSSLWSVAFWGNKCDRDEACTRKSNNSALNWRGVRARWNKCQ